MPSLVRNAGVGGSTTNVTGLNCTTALTVCLWARIPGAGTSGDIIRHASTANNARDGFRVGFSAADFRLDILGSAGSSNYSPVTGGRHRDGRWHHFTATYDSANNQICGYFDGALVNTVNNATRDITANASCTTVWNSGVIGSFVGNIFDFQILPDVVVPPGDVRLLMDPTYKYQGVKGRYFGLNFNTTATGTGACIDESGSGNNLTISPNAFQQGEEPPWRSTYQ